MLSSTRGNSFGISKKILCVIMTISLSLMMLPSALFRTEAQAAPTGENSLNLEDNHFGEFVYDTSNSANKVVFDDKTILEKVAALQETDVKIIESASAALKASLIENKYSMMEENLPQAEEGYKVTPTSITSIISQLSCVAPSKIENTDKWQFAISNPPSSLVTGDLLINAALATYKADYLIPFDNNFVPTQEIKYEFDYAGAKGLVKLNASGKTNEKGNVLTLVSLEAQVKSIAKTDIKYGVSVKLGEAPANNDSDTEVNVRVLNGDVFNTVTDITGTVEGSGESTVTFKDDVTPSDYTYDVDVSTISAYVETASFVLTDSKVKISKFKKASASSLTFKLKASDSSTNTVVDTATITITKINPKSFGVDIKSIVTGLQMMEYADQKIPATTAINNADPIGKTADGDDVKLLVKSGANPLQSYSVSWDATTAKINKENIQVAINNIPTSDYVANFTTDEVDIAVPGNADLASSVKVSDGVWGEVTAEQLPTHLFIMKDWIKVQRKGNYEIADKKDGKFKTSSFTPEISQKSGITYEFNLYVKNEDKTITKLSQEILYLLGGNPYAGFELQYDQSNTKFGEFDDGDFLGSIINGIKFLFSSKDVKIVFKYPIVVKDYINKAVIKDKSDNIIFNDTDLSRETDSSHIKLTATINADSLGYYESNIKNWTITPTNSSSQTSDYLKTDVYVDDTQPSVIVANADRPYEVSYNWSTLTQEGEKPVQEPTGFVVFSSDVTKVFLDVSVNMTNPDRQPKSLDASNIFAYSQLLKSKDESLNTIASVFSERLNSYLDTKLLYSDFSKEGNIWKARLAVDLDHLSAAGLSSEDSFTVNVKAIDDIFGRVAEKGKTTASEFKFSIDNSSPVLSVSFKGPEKINTVDGKDYYGASRNAEVIVEEMNFSGSLVTLERNYVDEVWAPSKDVLTTDNWEKIGTYEHKISIPFNYQGDYNLYIDGKDRSGNLLVGKEGTVVDEDGKYQSDTFCQDWRDPILRISWDNSNVVNGKYYTSGRNVNFTIEERNFDKDLVLFNGSHPEWGDAGTNVHTLSQSYLTEGDFSIVLAGTDIVFREFITYSEEFTIDWTKPNIQISGVENRQAYGDTAQPNVTITDANMAPSTTCQVESLGATKGHPYNAGPATSRTNYTYSYANPEAVPENDGVYRINVNAVDMAGNGDVQERVWSVNRFGSTYVIDAETETMMDGYVNKDSIKDVIVTEINPSGVENHSIDMTKGSFTETLNEGTDYTAAASGGDGTWYECIYTISKDFFKEDGKYTLNYISKDKAGNENENTMANKNADRNAAVNVQFMYDNAKPTVSYDNLSESLYAEANHKATANFEDNSKKFTEAKVIINGEENYVSGDDMDKKHNAIEFELKDSGTPYTIETVAIDKAGNEMDKDVKTVVVTMNPFLLWFYNTPLFVGSLVGAGVIVAGVLFFLYRRGLWIFKK